SQMAKLVEAVRPEARLVLVGDPQQLASVEAGAVLGDIVGPAADRLLIRAAARAELTAATGTAVDADDPPAGTAIGDGIVVLRRVHRFGGGIAGVADAVRRGDPDATLAALSAGHDDVAWIPVDLADPGAAGASLTAVRLAAVFERRGQILEFSPARLSAVETVHVMTVHKSQGSQFDTVAALLPDPDSPILTRELLYTAVTRARRRLLLAGSDAAVRAAVT